MHRKHKQIGNGNTISIVVLQWTDFMLTFLVFVTLLVANWGIPIAAIIDMKKDPEIISGKMTTGRL